MPVLACQSTVVASYHGLAVEKRAFFWVKSNGDPKNPGYQWSIYSLSL